MYLNSSEWFSLADAHSAQLYTSFLTCLRDLFQSHSDGVTISYGTCKKLNFSRTFWLLPLHFALWTSSLSEQILPLSKIHPASNQHHYLDIIKQENLTFFLCCLCLVYCQCYILQNCRKNGVLTWRPKTKWWANIRKKKKMLFFVLSSWRGW